MIALKAIEVPLSSPLDVELPEEAARVDSRGPRRAPSPPTTTSRSTPGSSAAGRDLVEVARVAKEADAGLILLGALPRPGATAGQARVFSETVENLLRRAACRVIVTAFPPGTASLPDPDVPVTAAH